MSSKMLIKPWIFEFMAEHRTKHGDDFGKRLDSPHARKCQIIKLRTRRTADQKNRPQAVWADISDSQSYMTAKFEPAAVQKLEETYSDVFDSRKYNVVNLRKFHSEKCIVPEEREQGARPVIVVEDFKWGTDRDEVINAGNLKRVFSMLRVQSRAQSETVELERKQTLPMETIEENRPLGSVDKGKQRAVDERPSDSYINGAEQSTTVAKRRQHFLLRKWPRLPSSEDLWIIPEDQRAILDSIKFGELNIPTQAVQQSPTPAGSSTEPLKPKIELVSPVKLLPSPPREPSPRSPSQPVQHSPSQSPLLTPSKVKIAPSQRSPSWDIPEDEFAQNEDKEPVLSEPDTDDLRVDQSSVLDIDEEQSREGDDSYEHTEDETDLLDNEVLSQGRATPQPESIGGPPSPRTTPVKKFPDASNELASNFTGGSERSLYPPFSNPGPVQVGNVLVPDSDTSMNHPSQSQSQSLSLGHSQPLSTQYPSQNADFPVARRLVDYIVPNDDDMLASQPLRPAPEEAPQNGLRVSEPPQVSSQAPVDEIPPVPLGQSLLELSPTQSNTEDMKMDVDAKEDLDQSAVKPPLDEIANHDQQRLSVEVVPTGIDESPRSPSNAPSNVQTASRSTSLSSHSRAKRPRPEDGNDKSSRRKSQGGRRKSSKLGSEVPAWINIIDDRPSQIDPWTQPSFLQRASTLPKVAPTTESNVGQPKSVVSREQERSTNGSLNGHSSAISLQSGDTEQVSRSNSTTEIIHIKQEYAPQVQLDVPPVPDPTRPISAKLLGGFNKDGYMLSNPVYGKASLVTWNDIASILERARG